MARVLDPSPAMPMPLAIVGAGRLGRALARAFHALGRPVRIVRRNEPLPTAGTVLLCVRDGEIAALAAELAAGVVVGHCSASVPLDVLAPHPRFVAHPLLSVSGEDTDFAGAACAVDGDSDATMGVAESFAAQLGMRPVRVPAALRPLYHAAASLAANYLVTLEHSAESLAVMCGLTRAELLPLVRSSVEAWGTRGFAQAITGPVARGDTATVARQRAAVRSHAPEHLALFDALTRATRTACAAARVPSPVGSGESAPAVVRSIAEVRQLVGAARARGDRVGLVPTMGALHSGHQALMRAARAECEVVVVSIFVNPTQFNDPSDLAAYPRTEASDIAAAHAAGATAIFAPSAREMYPNGFGTSIDVGPVTEPLEGEARGPVHFRGVATVVCKLLNIVAPDVAYFGQKDAQQARVVQQLVRDLDMPVRIVVCPTVREADGLALSSRNARLTPTAREQALALSRALDAMTAAVHGGLRSGDALTRVGRETLHANGVTDDAIDYVSVADVETLQPVGTLSGPALLLIAAHVGGVRLIDNARVDARATADSGSARDALPEHST